MTDLLVTSGDDGELSAPKFPGVASLRVVPPSGRYRDGPLPRPSRPPIVQPTERSEIEFCRVRAAGDAKGICVVTMPPFQGSITALITPFKDGFLDEGAFRKFVEWRD